MKVIIQRVNHAKVTIINEPEKEIEQGFLLLVGIKKGDSKEVVEKIAKKVVDLRIFNDSNGKMNLSIQDINGKILSISQFTLYADCKRGRRPGFELAEKPQKANEMYEYFNSKLRNYGIIVKTGVFGADMKVSLCNDGPVTIILDSDEL